MSFASQIDKFRKKRILENRESTLLLDVKNSIKCSEDFIYKIGLHGIQELEKKDACFREFKQIFFENDVIKNQELERSLEKNLRNFLVFLSPYIQFNMAHRVLEWLIQKYSVEKIGVDNLILLVLPYYKTRIFKRILQTLPLSDEGSMWYWLKPYQNSRSILTIDIISSQLMSDSRFMKLMCNHLLFLQSISRTFYASVFYDFFFLLILRNLQTAKQMSNLHLNFLISTLYQGLSGSDPNFLACLYAVFAKILSDFAVKKSVIKVLLAGLSERVILKQDFLLFLTFVNGLKNRVKFPHAVHKTLTRTWFLESYKTVKSFGLDLGIFMRLCFNIYSDSIARLEDRSTFEANTADIFYGNHLKERDAFPALHSILMMEKKERSIANNESPFFINCQLFSAKYPNVYNTYFKNLIELPQSNFALEVIVMFLVNDLKKKEKSKYFDFFSKLEYADSSLTIDELQYFLIKKNQCLNSFVKYKNIVNQFVEHIFHTRNKGVIKNVLNGSSNSTTILLNKKRLVDEIQKFLCKHRYDRVAKDLTKAAVKVLLDISDEDENLNIFIILIPFLFPLENVDLDITLDILKSKYAQKNLYLQTVAEEVKTTTDAQLIRSVTFHNILLPSLLPRPEDIIKTIAEDDLCSDTVSNFFKLIILGSVCRVSVGSLSAGTGKEIINVATRIFKKQSKINTLKELTTINTENLINALNYTYQDILPLQIYTYVLEIVHRRLNLNVDSTLDFVQEPDRCELIITVLECLLDGIIETKTCSDLEAYRSHFCWCLKIFIQRHFRKIEDLISFLSQLFIKPVKSKMTLLCLKVCVVLLDDCRSLCWIQNDVNFITNLLIVFNSNIFCRKAAIELTSFLISKMKVGNRGLGVLLSDLNSNSLEIFANKNYIMIAIYVALSSDLDVIQNYNQDEIIERKRARKILLEMLADAKLTYHGSSQLLTILQHVNDAGTLLKLIPLGFKLLEALKTYSTNAYINAALVNIIRRFNSDTLSVLENKSAKNLFINCMKDFNDIASSSKDLNLSKVILKQINQIFSENTQKKIQEEIFKNIIDIATDTNNDNVLLAVTKTLKKITVDADLVIKELNLMIKQGGPHTGVVSENKRNILKFSLSKQQNNEVCINRDWIRGITLLQFMKSSMNIKNKMDLVPTLFCLLKKSLQFEEQSLADNFKQLLLSLIYYLVESDLKTGNNDEFIDIVIKCIRSSHSLQTCHHALILLLKLLELQDLDNVQGLFANIMPVIVFIGDSIVRQEDVYSNQIIHEIMETVVVFIKAQNNLHHTIELLRTFINAFNDIPKHRRFLLFKKLLSLLDDHLHLFVILTFENYVMAYQHENPQKSNEKLDFAFSVCQEFSFENVIESCTKLLKFSEIFFNNEYQGNVEYEALRKTVENIIDVPKLRRHYVFVLLRFVVDLVSAYSLSHSKNRRGHEELSNHLMRVSISFTETVCENLKNHQDDKDKKYWKVLFSYVCKLFEFSTNWLSDGVFVEYAQHLLKIRNFEVKKKCLESLNYRLMQKKIHSFTHEDCSRILTSLTNVLKEETVYTKFELDSLYQAVFNGIRLTGKLLQTDKKSFDLFLSLITQIITKQDYLSSSYAALCLADTSSSMRVQCFQYIHKCIPIILEMIRKCNKNCDGFYSHNVTAANLLISLQKITESFGHLLPVFIDTIIYESVIFLHLSGEAQNNKVLLLASRIQQNLSNLNNFTNIRILLTAFEKVYHNFLNNKELVYIPTFVELVSDILKNCKGTKSNNCAHEFSAFLFKLLEFRQQNICSTEMVTQVENSICKLFDVFKLKLNEKAFYAIHYKLFHWVCKTPSCPNQNIIFYRLLAQTTKYSKTLFLTFEEQFMHHTASLLRSVDLSSSFSEHDSAELIKNVLLTILNVLNSSAAINESMLNTLINAIMYQVDNSFKRRNVFSEIIEPIIVRCIAAFTSATEDFTIRKEMIYLILSKSRHSEPYVRMLAIKILVEVSERLKIHFLEFLPEILPYLAELLEDDNEEIKKATENVIKYFESSTEKSKEYVVQNN